MIEESLMNSMYSAPSEKPETEINRVPVPTPKKGKKGKKVKEIKKEIRNTPDPETGRMMNWMGLY